MQGQGRHTGHGQAEERNRENRPTGGGKRRQQGEDQRLALEQVEACPILPLDTAFADLISRDARAT